MKGGERELDALTSFGAYAPAITPSGDSREITFQNINKF